jgi:hypothetical protein
LYLCSFSVFVAFLVSLFLPVPWWFHLVEEIPFVTGVHNSSSTVPNRYSTVSLSQQLLHDDCWCLLFQCPFAFGCRFLAALAQDWVVHGSFGIIYIPISWLLFFF